MLKSHIRKIAMSALFTITLATMGLPFYGYYGVSEIPGFAALFAHRILLSSSDPAVFSNPFVFVISILLYFGNVWWVKSGKTSGLLPKLLAILPMCLIELGKWEFLLLLYEHDVRFALFGFWLHSFLNFASIMVHIVLSDRKSKKFL